jgi:hypothetical protein
MLEGKKVFRMLRPHNQATVKALSFLEGLLQQLKTL